MAAQSTVNKICNGNLTYSLFSLTLLVLCGVGGVLDGVDCMHTRVKAVDRYVRTSVHCRRVRHEIPTNDDVIRSIDLYRMLLD